MKKIILAFIITSMSLTPAMAGSKKTGKMSSGEAAIRVLFFPLLFVGAVSSSKTSKKEEKIEEKKEKAPVRQPAMVGLKEHNQKLKKEEQKSK